MSYASIFAVQPREQFTIVSVIAYNNSDQEVFRFDSITPLNLITALLPKTSVAAQVKEDCTTYGFSVDRVIFPDLSVY
jgi:hypothetical protein